MSIDNGSLRWAFEISSDTAVSGMISNFAGTIPLGALAPGDYQLNTFSWGAPQPVVSFNVPPSTNGTIVNPVYSGNEFSFDLNGTGNVRYITERTIDFDKWDTIDIKDGVELPVSVPAGELLGNDMFRLRLEPLEVSTP